MRNEPTPTSIGNASEVPHVPLVLGALGLLPFVSLSAATFFVEASVQESVVAALATYGAIILSFLGGIQWGLAVRERRGDTPDRRILLLSVLPSLGGWFALLSLPSQTGLQVMAAGFLLVLGADILLSKKDLAPVWYPRLRWPLTLVVVSCLSIGSFSSSL